MRFENQVDLTTFDIKFIYTLKIRFKNYAA